MASLTTQTPPQTTKGLTEIWNDLVTPAPDLSLSDQQRAKLLSATTLAFIPLALFAIFLTPINNFLQTGVFNLPSPALLITLMLIFASYALSRTRHYWWGAMGIIIVPYLAVVGSALTSTTALNPSTFFFMCLSVTFASLLLTARETLIAGAIALALVFLVYNVRIEGPVTVDTTVIIFIVVFTGTTAVVSNIRDRNLLALESSRKELQQQVIETTEARERAERSDQVKSAFLASMSHELRTPLNAIINFTRYVAKGSLGAVNAEQAETLGEVVDSARHLLNLINDVLDMSKIEAGSLKLFVEDNVELKPIIDTVVSTGKSLITEKPVEIQVEIKPNITTMRGDRQRILQILLNIMSNACKFTETGTITVRADQSGDEIIFMIADTGPGIDDHDQGAVFEAFKQTNNGLRQGGGTGLGMPISKSLTEAHGGRLWLESKAGSGSKFYVALPIKSEALTPSIQS